MQNQSPVQPPNKPSLLSECPILRQIFEDRTLRENKINLPGDQTVSLFDSTLELEYGQILFDAVLQEKPRRVIEIGMACGISSLAMMTGLKRLGGGTLTSVDPYQLTYFRGAGAEFVKTAGLSAMHTLVVKADYLFLPQLVSEGESGKFDFAYIDGNHTFDYTLLDAWYLDLLVRPGGILAFNDCSYQAVHRVINWLLSHRAYEEVNFLGRPHRRINFNWKQEIKRRLHGQSRAQWYPLAEDRYFRKLKDTDSPWDFYAPF